MEHKFDGIKKIRENQLDQFNPCPNPVNLQKIRIKMKLHLWKILLRHLQRPSGLGEKNG